MHTIIQCKVTVGPVKEKKIRDPLVGLWIYRLSFSVWIMSKDGVAY